MATYRLCWFCIVKKDGKSLSLVHNLQPLNTVTIHDASLLPFIEHLAESFAGYAVYGMMDLYSGYNQRAEGSTILLGCRTMLGECCLAAI
jgi:hypothetical protein